MMGEEAGRGFVLRARIDDEHDDDEGVSASTMTPAHEADRPMMDTHAHTQSQRPPKTTLPITSVLLMRGGRGLLMGITY